MTQNNHASPLPAWRKGQPLQRASINQLVDHANSLSSIVGGPGIAVTRTGRSVTLALDGEPGLIAADTLFPARITAADSGAHAWTELQPTTGGSFQNKPAGRSGTTSSNPAYEVNGRTSVPANTIVWIKESRSDSDVTRYLFDLGMGNAGSALSMTHTGQHPEAAATTSWNINNQSEQRGVSVTLQTGSRYDASATTPTLYAYQRTFSFDANGHLTAISAESRVIVDMPEACS